MGGKGVGHIGSRTTGKARISPGTSHRCGKQCTRRAARGGTEYNSTTTPTQSYAPYFESEVSNSASPAGGSCQVCRGPAKSGTDGLRSYEASHRPLGDVRLWHLADNPTAPAFVCYWSNSGQSIKPIAEDRKRRSTRCPVAHAPLGQFTPGAYGSSRLYGYGNLAARDCDFTALFVSDF